MKPIILACAAALTATAALAHSDAEDTTPADDASVETVEIIEMRFNDPMRITAVTLTGPDGEIDVERETGMEPLIEFRAAPSEDLRDGDYTVDWRGLSADGHPMQGNFAFTVAD